MATLLRRTCLLVVLLLGLTAGVAHAGPAAQTTIGPGADISSPQCGGAYPAGASFGFVGVNAGTFATYNPCLTSELGWAALLGRAPQLYILAANPGPGGTFWHMGGDLPCDGSDSAGCAFDYGQKGAEQAVAQAAPALSGPVFWWVDVEAVNTFSSDKTLNNDEVAGEVTGLEQSGLASGVGIYTHAPPGNGNPSELVSLLGNVKDLSSLPLWLSTGPGDAGQAAAACALTSDTGGPIVYGQALIGGFDADVACAPRPKLSKIAGPLSTTTQLGGSGLPGTTVTIRVRDLAGAALAGLISTTVSPGGTWSVKVPFTRDGQVTVTGDSGVSTGDLRPKIVVTLSSRYRATGSCSATLSGTTTNWWKGQQVQLKGGAKTVKVATKKTSHGGSYSATVAGLCGRGRTIVASVDGLSGRQRLTEAGNSSKLKAHTTH